MFILLMYATILPYCYALHSTLQQMTDPGVTSSASTTTSASATPRTSTTAVPVGDAPGSERRTSKEAAVLSEGVAGIALADALSASGAVGPSVPITTTAAATTAAANSTATTTAGEDQADQDGTSSNNRCC